jgi:hypothetical protein
MTAIYYFLRRLWFYVFPRKVGEKGWIPTKGFKPSAIALPTAPASWTSPRVRWGMLGNGPDPANTPQFPNGAGDCVVAGILHAIMAVASFLKVAASFTTPEALAAYLALTGGVDSGLNPPGVFEEWQGGTLPAPARIFGKGGPFVSLDPTNVQQMKDAIATFGWVGVASNLQQAQEDQFSSGQRWDYVPGSPVVGGHFVIFTGFDKRNVGPYTVSWAKGFRSTWSWVTNTCVEAYTGVLPPVLDAGKYVLPVSKLDTLCTALPGA